MRLGVLVGLRCSSIIYLRFSTVEVRERIGGVADRHARWAGVSPLGDGPPAIQLSGMFWMPTTASPL